MGEAVMELDDIVGKFYKVLKSRNILDNTVIIFASDNGAIAQYTSEQRTKRENYFWHRYGHYQNSLDIDGKTVFLRGGKETAYDGGNRFASFFVFNC